MSEVIKKAKPILGVVTSVKMNKSRVARVDRLVKHERYGKYIRRSTKIMFHDEENSSAVGDSVLITPARPRSKLKKFDLLKIVNKTSSDS